MRSVAVLNTLLAKVMVKVIQAIAIVTIHFFATGQFMGFPGSPGPSHSIRFGSLSCAFACTCPRCCSCFFSSAPAFSTSRAPSPTLPHESSEYAGLRCLLW